VPESASHALTQARRAAADGSEVTAAIPADRDAAALALGEKVVSLTNLRKPFWPELRLTKSDLLRYYVRVSHVLLPHPRGRPMVMKRDPDGAHGPRFFMKCAPAHRPSSVRTCSIEHALGSVIDFVRPTFTFAMRPSASSA
jgi:bifunctional non-homologous end joining protein LigD